MEDTTRVNNGMTIVCTFNPLLDAVYSMLSPDFIKAGAIARDVAAGLGFPGAPMIFVRTIPDAPEQAAAPPVPTFDYPDIDGNMHTFTTTQFTDFYRAMRDLLHEMQIQTDVMAAGGTPVWPSQTMAI
jgi:hypothetical protein